MRVGIVCGGPKEYLPQLKEETIDYWIGADYGAIYLLEGGLPLDLAIGDFDSITKEQLNLIHLNAKQVLTYPSMKDETDTQLAIMEAIKVKATEIVLFGATGGRFDHTFANVWLLQQVIKDYPEVACSIIDKKNKIEMLLPGEYSIKKEEAYPYISFYAISEKVEKLNLTNFKYPLQDETLLIGSILCISNEFIKDYGNVSFSSGILLLVRSTD